MNTNLRRMAVLSVAALALLGGAASDARAQFMFVSRPVIFDPVTQEVFFTIEFNQPPDFFTVGQGGAQTHSFQYAIPGDPVLPYPANYDAIIRGEEIHFSGDTIRIRNASPSVADPEAGGWGSIRGEVPFSIDGNTLSFSAPLEVIRDHAVNGRFDYELMSVQSGLRHGFAGKPRIHLGATVIGSCK